MMQENDLMGSQELELVSVEQVLGDLYIDLA